MGLVPFPRKKGPLCRHGLSCSDALGWKGWVVAGLNDIQCMGMGTQSAGRENAEA
jgi:hypothetical protein